MFYRARRSIDIWVHAVSLGEVIAVTPLIEAIQSTWPDKRLLITTTTPTGSKKVLEHFGGSVAHVYLPYDLTSLVTRFLSIWRPKVALFMETEVWPNLLLQCNKRSIATMLVNARLSAESFKGYQKWQWLCPNVFKTISCIAAQSEPEATRFKALGAEHVYVSGSLKFDLTISEALVEKAALIRPEGRIILVAASTHPGEEVIILEVYKALQKLEPKLFLVLVPRHPERGEALQLLCRRNNLRSLLHSKADSFETRTSDVYIVDTTGELMFFYALCDIAFVGGSLVPHGGHNLIEPCALGKTVISGSFVKNFLDLRRILEAEDATVYVRDQDELYEHLRCLLKDPVQRISMGEKAKACVDKQRGSLGRQLALVQEMLSSIST